MTGEVRYRRSEEVAFRQIGDECLLVPVRTRPEQSMGIFTLNAVGAFLWLSLTDPIPAGELTRRLVQEFEVGEEAARGDVERFLQQLESRQLVERIGS